MKKYFLPLLTGAMLFIHPNFTVAEDGKSMPDPSSFFSSADSDGNGEITLDEFKAFQPPGLPFQLPEKAKITRFEYIDENSDGKITSEEMQKNAPQKR